MAKIGRPTKETHAAHHAKAWRDHFNMSQERLAERMAELLGRPGFDRDQLSKIERGDTKLAEKMQLALAKALGIEPGALWVRPDVYLDRKRKIELVESIPFDKLEATIELIRKLAS